MYTKKVGAKPDFADPVILSSDRGGTLLEHLCRQIHNSMVAQLNYALVWGTSSKHYPQRYAATAIVFWVTCQSLSWNSMVAQLFCALSEHQEQDSDVTCAPSTYSPNASFDTVLHQL